MTIQEEPIMAARVRLLPAGGDQSGFANMARRYGNNPAWIAAYQAQQQALAVATEARAVHEEARAEAAELPAEVTDSDGGDITALVHAKARAKVEQTATVMTASDDAFKAACQDYNKVAHSLVRAGKRRH